MRNHLPLITGLNPDKDLREECSRDHGELSQTKGGETRRFRQVLETEQFPHRRNHQRFVTVVILYAKSYLP